MSYDVQSGIEAVEDSPMRLIYETKGSEPSSNPAPEDPQQDPESAQRESPSEHPGSLWSAPEKEKARQVALKEALNMVQQKAHEPETSQRRKMSQRN